MLDIFLNKDFNHQFIISEYNLTIYGYFDVMNDSKYSNTDLENRTPSFSKSGDPMLLIQQFKQDGIDQANHF